MTKKRSSIAVRIYRSKSWTRKAETFRDDLDGTFIFYWVAFNALYGQPRYLLPKRNGGEERDFEQFLELVNTLDTKGRISGLLEQLKWPILGLTEDNYLNDETWRGWQERGLESLEEREKNSFFDKRRDDCLPGLFRRIYVLRKQLFQREKNGDILVFLRHLSGPPARFASL